MNETRVDRSALDQTTWYRVGSIAAVALGVGYIIILVLYARAGEPPHGGEAWFNYLPGKVTIWWAIIALSVITDFLFIPLALALYLALQRIDRSAMLLATAFIGLFAVLDLAVTWSHYTSILILYDRYAATTDGVQRAIYLAAASYGAAMLTSPLEVTYSIVTLSSGILMASFVMLRGRFDAVTAYFGVATGLLGIASLTGFSPAIIGNAVAAMAWLFSLGYRLYRLARK